MGGFQHGSEKRIELQERKWDPVLVQFKTGFGFFGLSVTHAKKKKNKATGSRRDSDGAARADNVNTSR